jgi:hypothetical protein
MARWYEVGEDLRKASMWAREQNGRAKLVVMPPSAYRSSRGVEPGGGVAAGAAADWMDVQHGVGHARLCGCRRGERSAERSIAQRLFTVRSTWA